MHTRELVPLTQCNRDASFVRYQLLVDTGARDRHISRFKISLDNCIASSYSTWTLQTTSNLSDRSHSFSPKLISRTSMEWCIIKLWVTWKW
ncbi:hypothetical protein BD410DRAFT_787561, partial [Rickenella mellea]